MKNARRRERECLGRSQNTVHTTHFQGFVVNIILFRGYTVDSWTLKAANLLSFEAGHEAPVAPVHRSLTV